MGKRPARRPATCACGSPYWPDTPRRTTCYDCIPKAPERPARAPKPKPAPTPLPKPQPGPSEPQPQPKWIFRRVPCCPDLDALLEPADWCGTVGEAVLTTWHGRVLILTYCPYCGKLIEAVGND